VTNPNPPKRFLVTGATHGMGRAISALLDSLGHQSLLVGRDQEELRRLQKELKGATVWPHDLSSLEGTEVLVERAREAMGGLDALINNAGTIDPIAPLKEADPVEWTRAIAVNLTAPALLMRAALPDLLASGGRIVNISTGAALKAMPGWAAYCASKAGLLHLTAVVAAEVPEVACFSLRPGVIDTGMQAAIRQSHGMRASDRERFLRLHQESALEPPEVPGRAAIWLALEGPRERSGELIDYTDPQVAAGVRSLFGKDTVSG
jgi:NAD(P)-dependent dehydrogenase (short-subunit alcohol dehydrogenase family)